jgi:hypothetical protein
MMLNIGAAELAVISCLSLMILSVVWLIYGRTRKND